MVSFHVFAKPHSRRTHKSYTTSALPLPCSLFNSPSKIPVVSRPPVTKSPVVHPLSVQLLTKCYSRNSFVLKMIHFDGGGVHPAALSSHLPGHSLAHFCIQQKYNSLVFNRLCTLLHDFADTQNSTLFFSINSALFCKNTRGWACAERKQTGGGELRDAADVFAGIHQPLIVGTVSFFQWRGFFLTLQVRRPFRQGRGAGSCCETSARLPRNLAAPFLAPSLHPQVRRERPRQISLEIPDRSLQESWSQSTGCGCRESLPAFSRPRRRFQEPCCRRPACLAAIRARRGHADLAELPNRRVSLRHAPPAPAPTGKVVLPAGRAWATPEESVEPCFFSSPLLRLNLHEPVTRWDVIVRALPLPLHFDAVLGRWMAEAMVCARQRTFADFRQHAEMNRGLFVRGRVRNWVRVAARQPVYGALDRIHGHVEFFALHPVGDQRAHAKLSVS